MSSATMNAMRTVLRKNGLKAGFTSKYFSTSVASTSTGTVPPVIIDRVKASTNMPRAPPMPQIEEQIRLPNDVHERNAIYEDEDRRSMAGVEASVRHVSFVMGATIFKE